jgi:hypothetical protein
MMELTVPERMKLLDILPEKNTYAGITEIFRLKLLLQLNNAEIEQIEADLDGEMIRWNQDKALALLVDVPMGEWVTNVIRQVLREKDFASDLEPAEISLYERFIIDYQI